MSNEYKLNGYGFPQKINLFTDVFTLNFSSPDLEKLYFFLYFDFEVSLYKIL